MTSQISELCGPRDNEPAPEARVSSAPVNFSDLKANLAEEWGSSLDALFQVTVKNPVTAEIAAEAAAKRDLYVLKIGATLSAFEQQLADRLRTPRYIRASRFC